MSDMTDPGNETRQVSVAGRDIQVLAMTDAQLILLGRDAQLLDSTSVDNKRKLAIAARIMDMFESTIATDEDRDYVMSLVVTRQLDMKGMAEILSADSATKEVAKKPVVRRGRPARAK